MECNDSFRDGVLLYIPNVHGVSASWLITKGIENWAVRQQHVISP